MFGLFVGILGFSIFIIGKSYSLAMSSNGLYIDPEEGWIAYFTDGYIDETYTGFAQLADGTSDHWYYVEDGFVLEDRDDIVPGIIDETDAGWYIHNGKVDFAYYGFVSNEEAT